MKFDLLKEKCEYYRGLQSDRFIPNMPLLIMVDGRSFSSLIKNRFNLPFDFDFINIMNDVALTLCRNIPGCVLGYVQSDEISLYITDNSETECFYSWRKEKLLSIVASIASSRFTHLLLLHDLNNNKDLISEELIGIAANSIEVQFDCKCWNVPNINEVFAWFLYRQNDCIRNSKQQTAQTYLPKKSLFNMVVDDQIELLASESGINWYAFEDDVKYGRFLYRENNEESVHKKWVVKPSFLLRGEDGRESFENLINI